MDVIFLSASSDDIITLSANQNPGVLFLGASYALSHSVFYSYLNASIGSSLAALFDG